MKPGSTSIKDNPAAWYALMRGEVEKFRESLASDWFKGLDAAQAAEHHRAGALLALDLLDAANAYVGFLETRAPVSQPDLFAGAAPSPLAAAEGMVAQGLKVLSSVGPDDLIRAVERLLKLARPGSKSKMRAQNVYHIHAPQLMSLSLAGEPFTMNRPAVETDTLNDRIVDALMEDASVQLAHDVDGKPVVLTLTLCGSLDDAGFLAGDERELLRLGGVLNHPPSLGNALHWYVDGH